MENDGNTDTPAFKEDELRSFEVCVADGASLYVNPYFLAEISSYFHQLCFGTFKETTDKKVTFKDETADSMRLLFGVLRARDYEVKEISLDNVCELLRLTQKYDIQLLYVRCRDFIQLNVKQFSVDVLVAILATLTNYHISSLDTTKWDVAEVLAEMNVVHLRGRKWSEVNDSALVACIIHTSMRNSHGATSTTTHRMTTSSSTIGDCQICRNYTTRNKCEKCSFYVCPNCVSQKCSVAAALIKNKIDRTFFL